MSEPLSVLVVDDEDELRSILAKLLERRGFKVFQANSGEEAIGLLASTTVDAVISDMNMPGMSGIELLKRIRQNSLNPPVVYLVSGFAEVSVEEVVQLGAADLLSKPFQMKVILEKLKPLLEIKTLGDKKSTV